MTKINSPTPHSRNSYTPLHFPRSRQQHPAYPHGYAPDGNSESTGHHASLVTQDGSSTKQQRRRYGKQGSDRFQHQYADGRVSTAAGHEVSPDAHVQNKHVSGAIDANHQQKVSTVTTEELSGGNEVSFDKPVSGSSMFAHESGGKSASPPPSDTSGASLTHRRTRGPRNTGGQGSPTHGPKRHLVRVRTCIPGQKAQVTLVALSDECYPSNPSYRNGFTESTDPVAASIPRPKNIVIRLPGQAQSTSVTTAEVGTDHVEDTIAQLHSNSQSPDSVCSSNASTKDSHPSPATAVSSLSASEEAKLSERVKKSLIVDSKYVAFRPRPFTYEGSTSTPPHLSYSPSFQQQFPGPVPMMAPTAASPFAPFPMAPDHFLPYLPMALGFPDPASAGVWPTPPPQHVPYDHLHPLYPFPNQMPPLSQGPVPPFPPAPLPSDIALMYPMYNSPLHGTGDHKMTDYSTTG